MGGSKPSPVTTTTQSNNPPAFIQPYLEDAAKQSQNLYQSGGPQYYPGQTVAPFSNQTQQGLTQTQNLATQGGQLLPAANNALLSTISGTNGLNPFLGSAVQSAAAPLFDQFNNQTIPGLQSIFARAGGTGGSAENAGFNQATTAFGRGLGEIGGSLAYQSAADERRNQLNAAVLAPQMDAARYADANKLLGVGSVYDAQNQANINADVAKYNYNQNLPALTLNQYIAQLTGDAGRYGTTTQQSSTTNPQGSPLLGVLGGAATGAVAGASIAGPLGAAPGIGIGALAGLGSANGWF